MYVEGVGGGGMDGSWVSVCGGGGRMSGGVGVYSWWGVLGECTVDGRVLGECTVGGVFWRSAQ